MLQVTQIGPSELQINSLKTGFPHSISYVILTLTLHRLLFPVLSQLYMQLMNVALGGMWAEAVAGNALTSTAHMIDASPRHPDVCPDLFLPP